MMYEKVLKKVTGLIVIILALFVSIIYDVTAQTNIQFTSFIIRDGNIYRNRAAYDEWINSSNLRLQYNFGKEKFQIGGYYSGDFLLYKNNNELDNFTHNLGLVTVLHDGDNTLNAAASVRLLNYKETFAYYNVTRYNLNGSYTINPDFNYLYTVGIALGKDAYKEFSELDNFSYRFYAKYQRSFQSKFSVTGEIGLGVKDYMNQSIIEYYGQSIDTSAALRYREEPVKAVMFSTTVALGKSIAAYTGIRLEIGGQWFIGDPIMSYTDGIYYYTENDLYDDPYSYQGPYVFLQLTQQLDLDFQAKIGVKVQRKNYTGTPALNALGEMMESNRDDTRKEYSFLISKKILVNWPALYGIDLFFSYMYRNNSSNDPYYGFKDHIGLLGFSVGI